VRVRRRYQEGGRTADLLAALERRRVMNQLNSDVQDRMPQPSPAPASSTRVAMQPPNRSRLMGLDHPSFRPQKTISQESVNYEDPANIFKMIGAPIQTAAAMNKMVQSGEFRRPTTAEIEAIGSRAMDLPFAMTPLGDVSDVLGAESGAELAMAAGLAFVPGNLSMIKDALPQFIRPGQIKIIEEALGAVDDASGNADELLAINMPQLSKMSEGARKEMASGLDEMAEDLMNFPMFSREEVNRLRETSKYLRSADIKQTSRAAAKKSTAPRSQIGDFEVEITPDGVGYRMQGSADYISLVENKPNEFTLVAMLEENVNPKTKGLLLAETIKQVPKGGVVKFGSVNDLSTDSYVFPLKYIENGKATADLRNVEFLKLNELGQSPKAFAKAFDIEPRQVGLIDGTAKASADEVAQVKGRIDAKLQSLGLPESKLSGDQILMPHFDMIKTIGKGEFKYGGNLRVVKQAPKGFRTKR